MWIVGVAESRGIARNGDVQAVGWPPPHEGGARCGIRRRPDSERTRGRGRRRDATDPHGSDHILRCIARRPVPLPYRPEHACLDRAPDVPRGLAASEELTGRPEVRHTRWSGGHAFAVVSTSSICAAEVLGRSERAVFRERIGVRRSTRLPAHCASACAPNADPWLRRRQATKRADGPQDPCRAQVHAAALTRAANAPMSVLGPPDAPSRHAAAGQERERSSGPRLVCRSVRGAQSSTPRASLHTERTPSRAPHAPQSPGRQGGGDSPRPGPSPRRR